MPRDQDQLVSGDVAHRGDTFLPTEPLLVLHAGADGVTSLVTDQRDTWRITWSPTARTWSCTCPARTTGCGHIAAVRAIVVLEVDPS